jgi:hypothetical protein
MPAIMFVTKLNSCLSDRRPRGRFLNEGESAMQNQVPTNLVAWYGAIVATGSLLIHFLNFRRDRAKLKVTATANMHGDERGPVILIEVANVGRRPVTLKTLPYFTVRGTKAGMIIGGDWQPKASLSEGERAAIIAVQKNLDLNALKSIVVTDETGRVWRSKVQNKVTQFTRTQ